jgi:molybdopterin-guanine dinucleotide biosynthesis protein A
MGRDKLDLTMGGQTLLESAVNRFSGVFEDVYISVADAAKYSDLSVRKVVDIFMGAGPMSGLHAALTSLPCDGVFLVAADLPYSCPYAAKRMIELCAGHEACLIRLPDGKLEPLFGYYRKSVLPRCDEAIRSGDYRMSELIYGAATRFVAPDELGELWDEKLILNVNYPEDYEKLR